MPLPTSPIAAHPRRAFVAGAAATAAAMLGSALADRSLAIEPFARPLPGKLRLSLAAYSLRKYLTPDTASMDLFQFVDYCADQGLAGAELTSYYFPDEPTVDYLLRLKRHCHLRGVTVTGGAIRNDFCTQDASQLAASIDHTRRWIDYYAVLGAPVIRIFAGNEQPGESNEATVVRCVQACHEVCSYAAEKGVWLALENHGGVTATAEGLLNIVRRIESPAFGVNFDSGNFFLSTQDPYAELAQIAPYAINAQLKVEIRLQGKKVTTDLPRVLAILSSSGYSGWVALEYEAAEEPLSAIPRWLGRLRPLFAEYE